MVRDEGTGEDDDLAGELGIEQGSRCSSCAPFRAVADVPGVVAEELRKCGSEGGFVAAFDLLHPTWYRPSTSRTRRAGSTTDQDADTGASANSTASPPPLTFPLLLPSLR